MSLVLAWNACSEVIGVQRHIKSLMRWANFFRVFQSFEIWVRMVVRSFMCLVLTYHVKILTGRHRWVKLSGFLFDKVTSLTINTYVICNVKTTTISLIAFDGCCLITLVTKRRLIVWTQISCFLVDLFKSVRKVRQLRIGSSFFPCLVKLLFTGIFVCFTAVVLPRVTCKLMFDSYRFVYGWLNIYSLSRDRSDVQVLLLIFDVYLLWKEGVWLMVSLLNWLFLEVKPRVSRCL